MLSETRNCRNCDSKIILYILKDTVKFNSNVDFLFSKSVWGKGIKTTCF